MLELEEEEDVDAGWVAMDNLSDEAPDDAFMQPASPINDQREAEALSEQNTFKTNYDMKLAAVDQGKSKLNCTPVQDFEIVLMGEPTN
jgi:hypothetical protein